MLTSQRGNHLLMSKVRCRTLIHGSTYICSTYFYVLKSTYVLHILHEDRTEREIGNLEMNYVQTHHFWLNPQIYSARMRG